MASKPRRVRKAAEEVKVPVEAVAGVEAEAPKRTLTPPPQSQPPKLIQNDQLCPVGGRLSPVSATMSSSYAVVSNDIYALTSAYWGLGCVFYQPGGAQMCCPKLACSDILASRTYFTTGWC